MDMGKKKKEFMVKDVSIAAYLKNNGSKLIKIHNGQYIFELDGTIDKNINAYFELYKKSMF